MTIVENLQRADLNPMEQARAYERLSPEFKMTQEQMAKRTGKDRASVANFLRLLKLPESRAGVGGDREAEFWACAGAAGAAESEERMVAAVEASAGGGSCRFGRRRCMSRDC